MAAQNFILSESRAKELSPAYRILLSDLADLGRELEAQRVKFGDIKRNYEEFVERNQGLETGPSATIVTDIENAVREANPIKAFQVYVQYDINRRTDYPFGRSTPKHFVSIAMEIETRIANVASSISAGPRHPGERTLYEASLLGQAEFIHDFMYQPGNSVFDNDLFARLSGIMWRSGEQIVWNGINIFTVGPYGETPPDVRDYVYPYYKRLNTITSLYQHYLDSTSTWTSLSRARAQKEEEEAKLTELQAKYDQLSQQVQDLEAELKTLEETTKIEVAARASEEAAASQGNLFSNYWLLGGLALLFLLSRTKKKEEEE